MKKQRFQPTFASLTEAELEQLASDVQRQTYDAVRIRVCKPRSEGGLDLHFTSNSPLVRLHNKKNRLDLINARITSGQKLTLAQLDSITAGNSGSGDNHSEHRAPEEIHNAIMSATWILVTENDNTPHQLLALQRLADFPARSEIRENRERIYQEKHTHKIDMDTFRKQHATERLDLAKRSLALREKTFDLRQEQQSAAHSPHSDTTLTPIASVVADDDDFDYENMPSISPNPLPPEVIARNLAFSKKLREGKIIIDHSGLPMNRGGGIVYREV